MTDVTNNLDSTGNSGPGRKMAFYIIAILLPFGLLLAAELILRVVGFGQSVPLFIDNPQAPSYRLPKPDVVNRYFSDPSRSPNVTIEPNFFLSEKPDNSVRIVVQGGSTAAGFPFGLGASLAGMLDYRLKQSIPSKEVEVVNTALSAVNSYTLLDFADEIIDQKPDAVLIYAGHNEFLGVMGVASTYSSFSSRPANLLFLKLKNLRLFQLFQRGYDAIQAWAGADALAKDGARQSRTVMAKVAKHKNVDVNHPLFNAGLEQFEGNMTLLLNKYRRAGIPVYISTIASNLVDQAPFESVPVSDDFASLLAKPATKLTTTELVSLERHAHETLSADAFYHVGKAYWSQAAYEQAKANFELARQHDLLRFRAPIEMNQIIRRLANMDGVQLVDAEAALSKASKGGIIGRKMMIEHLHPTVRGYFELSNAFYDTLKQSNEFGPFENPITKADAIRDIPLFQAEEYKGRAVIANLMADYPFTDSPQIASLPPAMNWQDKLGLNFYRKKATWLDVAQQMHQFGLKSKDKKLTLKSAKLLSDAMPFDEDLAFQAGQLLIKEGLPKQAFRYLERVLRQNPSDINAKLALAHASALTEQLKKAEQYLLEVQKLQPNNKVVKQNLIPLQKAIQAQAEQKR